MFIKNMINGVAYVASGSEESQTLFWQDELRSRDIESDSVKPVLSCLIYFAVDKLRKVNSPQDSLNREYKKGICYESYLIDGRLVEVIEKPGEDDSRHPLIAVRSNRKLAESKWLRKLEGMLSLFGPKVPEERLPEEVRKVLGLSTASPK